MIKKRSSEWVGIFSQLSWPAIAMMIALLFSALLVLYCKDRQRCLLIQYQRLKQQHVHMHAEKGRLLLEAGALSNQQHVQEIAQQELKMHIPSSREITTLRAAS